MSKAYTFYKMRYLDPIQKEIEDKDFFMVVKYIEFAKHTIKYRLYQDNMTEEEKKRLSEEFKELVSNREFKEYLDSLMTLQ